MSIRRQTVLPYVAYSFSVAICAGLGNSLTAMLSEPPALADFRLAAAVAGASVLGALPLAGGLAFILARWRMDRESRIALAGAVGVAVTVFAAWLGYPAGPESVPTLMSVLPWVLGLLTLMAVRHGRVEAVLVRLRWVALTWGPIVMSLATAYTWLRVYRFPGPLSAPGLLVTASAIVLATGSLGGVALFLARPPRARLRLLAAVAVALGLATVAAVGLRWSLAPVPPGDASSVVLVTVDTLRQDVLLAEGAMPQLSALRSDSVSFPDARSPSPWTKPAMASMLTGVSPLLHGVITMGQGLPDQLKTLAEYLHDAGYKTAAVTTNVFMDEQYGFDRGFDVYDHYPKRRAGLSIGARLMGFAGWYRPGTVNTTGLIDRAISRLDAIGEGPFFLWVHILDPHVPYRPRGRYRLPPAPAESRVQDALINPDRIRDGSFVPSAVEKSRIQDLYMAEVRYVDANVGRLLAALKKNQIYDETLVVFSSDHGEEFWEHGAYEHGHTLYDELLRVPLLIKPPANVGAREIHGAVSTAAITPTVLDFAGLLAADHAFTSDSLRPYIRDRGEQVAPMPLISAGMLYGEPRLGMVLGSEKVILTLRNNGTETYDLAADPRERSPLPPENDRARQLLDRLDAERRRLHTLAVDMQLVPEATPLDPETRRQLRALGYVQ